MSHHVRPTIIETIFNGNCSCPHILIGPDFLHWAYSHRTVSGITCFLGIHRDTVKSVLLEHGIVEPQENPFESCLAEPVVDVLPLVGDKLLDPHSTLPNKLHQTFNHQGHSQHQMAPVLDLRFWCYFIHWTPVQHFRCQSWWLGHSSSMTFSAHRN